MQDHDVVIVGAGPAGLSGAISLARLGLKIAVIERQDLGGIADPRIDGRDIALTGLSRNVLTELGVWQRFDAADISPIASAQVLDGDGPGLLRFDAPASKREPLGYLVSNHLIRRALYETAIERPEIDLLTGHKVTALRPQGATTAGVLESGDLVDGRLLIAADSRFSEVRRMMGIEADATPFGKTMLVFRMSHQYPHQQTAYECFGYGFTLALLPLNGARSSVVLTVPTAQAAEIVAMGDEALAVLVTERLNHRFGRMTMEGDRFAYPLTGMYARRFAGPRYALLGDAAVGMHPVTAHGFNFGLLGQAILSDEIAGALRGGGDIGGAAVLGNYESGLRRATRPLYLATNAIVGLYTNDSPPARLARSALLAVADRVAPVKRLIVASLGQTRERHALRAR